MDVRARLRNIAKYMESTKTNLYFQDNWNSLLAEPHSFNARHSRALVVITAEELLKESYSALRGRFLEQEDYIMGFRSDIMAKDDAEFVGECLLPDYTGGERTNLPETDDDFWRLPSDQINVPMLLSTMYHYKYVVDSSYADASVAWIFAAPCYLYLVPKLSVLEREKDFLSLSDLCMEIYMADCVRRND